MITTKNTKDTKTREEFDELSHRVIGCALVVHRVLGPGLLESTYERCLAHELTLTGIPFQLQAGLPVEYKGIHLDCGFEWMSLSTRP